MTEIIAPRYHAGQTNKENTGMAVPKDMIERGTAALRDYLAENDGAVDAEAAATVVLSAALSAREPLTPTQAAALDWLKAWLAENDAAPTIYEMAKGMGGSHQNAAKLLGILQRKGYILREEGVARSIRLSE